MKPEGITYYTPAEYHGQNGVWSYNIEKKFMEPSFVPEVGDVIRFGGEKGDNDYAIVYDVEIIATEDRHFIEVYCERVVGKYDCRPREWFMEKAKTDAEFFMDEVLDLDTGFMSKQMRKLIPKLKDGCDKVEFKGTRRR